MTSDTAYTPALANPFTNTWGTSFSLQIQGPGRATFTAFSYSDTFNALNTSTAPDGGSVVSSTSFTGPHSIGDPRTFPFSCHYSVYSLITAFSGVVRSQWAAVDGLQETLVGPRCSVLTLFRVSLILLLLSITPVSALSLVVYCRAQKLRTEAEAFTAQCQATQQRPRREDETIDLEEPPMPLPEPDGERLPRVWTGTVIVHGWMLLWGGGGGGVSEPVGQQ